MRLVQQHLLYILMISMLGCSHKYGIYKTYAYTRTITAGTIPVDEQNRPTTSGIERSYLIYVETSDTLIKPQWDTAWIKGTAFTIQPLKIQQNNITIGKTAKEQKAVSLSPAETNSLWQLLLTPLNHVEPSEEIKKQMEKDKIVLTGKWEGEYVRYTIKKITELERIWGE